MLGRKQGAGGAQAAIGGVTCMDHHDMTGDGVKDLIVARDGGAIQVGYFEYKVTVSYYGVKDLIIARDGVTQEFSCKKTR